MAEVNPGDLPTQAAGFLEVCLTGVRMCGYAGPEWPRFCFIYVGVGGQLVGSRMLPFEFDKNVLKSWRLMIRVPVALDWADLSLDVFVERADCFHGRRGNLVAVTRGGPHTSNYTAVIGRARLGLLDALVIGDLDDEEEEEEEEDQNKKPRSEGEERNPRLKGTVPFGKTVPLLDWELPALGDADGAPRSLVRGTVDVRMFLRRLPGPGYN